MPRSPEPKHRSWYYSAPQRNVNISMADSDFKLSNVQGDILVGLSKKTEVFFFFRITDATAFKSQLKTLVPLITTADKATGEKAAIRAFKASRAHGVNGDGTNELGEITGDGDLLPIAGVNIAFSQKGLTAVGQACPAVRDNLNLTLHSSASRMIYRTRCSAPGRGRTPVLLPIKVQGKLTRTSNRTGMRHFCKTAKRSMA
ncbi:hypothetical protein DPSP01_008540 [Paraphaeosphaeria sporulosa]